MKLKELSLSLIGFLQALGVTFYCGLVGFLLTNGDKWFGRMTNLLGPLLLLLLLVVSVLICALIALYYPLVLFLDERQTGRGIKLVVYTALWLILFTILLIFTLAIS